MNMPVKMVAAVPLMLALCVAGCAKPAPPAANTEAAAPAPAVESATEGTSGFQWSPGFRVMGDGYPNAGDPCRRLGETELTGNYLDHTAWLIGCPGTPEEPAAAAVIATGGRVMGQAEGVTMISVPMPAGG